MRAAWFVEARGACPALPPMITACFSHYIIISEIGVICLGDGVHVREVRDDRNAVREHEQLQAAAEQGGPCGDD